MSKRNSKRPNRSFKKELKESASGRKVMNTKKMFGSRGKKKSVKGAFNREELEGIVSMTREGYGFVAVEGRNDDIFIAASNMRHAFNGDRVKIVTTREKGRNNDGSARRIEGVVEAIIERSRKPHIGILQVIRSEAWLIMESRSMPYDIRIPISEMNKWFSVGEISKKESERRDKKGKGGGEREGARGEREEILGWKPQDVNGLKVAVLVEEWSRRIGAPMGKIVDVLGEPGVNDTEMHSILVEYGLPYRFEPEVEEIADRIPEVITPKEISARRDFRNLTTLTIDPADAKDFDDAISFLPLKNGNYEVGVHIADVTHYIQPGSVLDKVAYERGTSVYLVDRTVPMLPEKLSNKLCSLRPNEDKLCFSAVFEMNEKGEILEQWFGKTIICSNHRFDYEEAQTIIETGKGEYSEEIGKLHLLATALRKKRFAAGAISFERPEMKVEVDEDGKPIRVYQKESKESNWLIEEFMLLANRCVAEHVGKVKKGAKGQQGEKQGSAKTFVYRIHENPNEEKVSSLRKFVKLFGYELGGEEGSAKGLAPALNSLLKKIKGTPEEDTIEMLALRAMARARYSTDNVGHYGLAFKYYSHFTSPIRRYPDMMVHRLLSLYLNGATSQDKKFYEEACEYSSQREQIATEAERASVKYKLVEFMQDKIGQVFPGTISGLTEWGMYVEIEPTKVEGMVALKEIRDDFYVFDEETYSITGKGTGKRYTLGDKVTVKVTRASLEQKVIDYELVYLTTSDA